MTEIEIAAAEWVKAYERATPSRHPSYWAAHYVGDRMLGAVHAPPRRDLAKAAFIFLAPFGYCPEVTDSFFIRDNQRTLELTRLSIDGRGMRQTSWKLYYSIDDGGKATLYTAVKAHPAKVIVGVCEAIGLARLNGGMTYEFDEIFRGALILAEENL